MYLDLGFSSVCDLQMSSNVVMLLAIVGVALRVKRWRCEVEQQQSRPTWSIQWICCRLTNNPVYIVRLDLDLSSKSPSGPLVYVHNEPAPVDRH